MWILGRLDEEIENAPPEYREGLKELFAQAILESVFRRKHFIKAFRETQAKFPDTIADYAEYTLRKIVWRSYLEYVFYGEVSP